MGDNQLELARMLRTGQDKYTYFLLAAAAAAIGLALNRTHGNAFALTMIPLGLAVTSWGVSFYFGCTKVS